MSLDRAQSLEICAGKTASPGIDAASKIPDGDGSDTGSHNKN
jgi:hypothetical protein